MLMPKKTRYRKVQRGRLKGRAKGGTTVCFGAYGLAAVAPAWVTARQLEAIRVTVGRKLKKVGKMFLRVFPQKAVSKKPAETRMGKGKGAPEFWVAPVKRDAIILEISGDFDVAAAKEILQSASYKLPMKTKFVSRENLV